MVGLDDAVAKALAKTADLHGLDALALVGSFARGDQMPNSDVDLVALIDDGVPWPAPVRDGGRDVFFDDSGRQVELSFTSVGRARRLIGDEAAPGRPFRLEWLVDARLVAGAGHSLRVLQDEARTILAAGPPALDDQELRWRCFEIWNAIKDAEDVLGVEATSVRMAHMAFENLLVFAFQVHCCWQPRPKALFARLSGLDPPLHAMALRFLAGSDPEDRYHELLRMKEHLAAVFKLEFEVPYISEPHRPEHPPTL